MSELILFPDVEQEACDHLTAAFAATTEFRGVTATGKVPTKRPSRFVRIRRTGGQQLGVIVDQPTIVVEGYASTDTGASRLCSYAVALLVQAGRDRRLGAAAVVSPGVVVPGAPQNLPDPVTDQARYTATVTVALRGSRA